MYRSILLEKTFMELLRTRKMDNITLVLLCEEEKISKSTFYHHYDSKKDLVLKIIEGSYIEYLQASKKDLLDDYLVVLFEMVKDKYVLYRRLGESSLKKEGFLFLLRLVYGTLRHYCPQILQEADKMSLEYFAGYIVYCLYNYQKQELKKTTAYYIMAIKNTIPLFLRHSSFFHDEKKSNKQT